MPESGKEKIDLFVSVVAVFHNQAAILRDFVAEVHAALESQYTNFEIVLIDSGSQDDTVAVARKVLSEFTCLRFQRLSVAAEDEIALIAGLDSAIGDFVVTLNPDFDPVREIAPMIERCRGGFDLVQGIDRSASQPGAFYRVLRGTFRGLARTSIGLDVPQGTSAFRVFSRHAVNAMTRVRSRRRYFALLAMNMGLSTVTHPYDRMSRSGSRPTRNLVRAIRLGLSVLVHYSILPLRLVSLLGLLGSGLSLLYSAYVVVIYVFKSDVMPGWTTLSLQVSGLFAIVFLMMALLSEYVGRLLEESPDRPLYFLRDEQSSAVMLADPKRKNVLSHTQEAPPSSPPATTSEAASPTTTGPAS